MTQLLTDKNAIVYGAAGSIGGAVAAAFAREGAIVWLASRTRATLDATAGKIRADGGRAEVAVVDALDEAAVDALVERIAAVWGEGAPTAAQAVAGIAAAAALKRAPRLAEVAETAAFLASDRASAITGTMVNVTCGLVLR